MRRLARRLVPLLLAGALGSSMALADVDFSIQADTLNPAQGDVGDAFDVLLTNTGPNPIDIGAFSFGVFTTDTGITFTEADLNTEVSPYIFAGDSFYQILVGTTVISIPAPVLLPALPAQYLIAGDTTADATDVVVLSGETVDLGTVLFDVSPTATPGDFTVLFTDSPTSQYNNLASYTTGGGVNVDNTSGAEFTITQSVPEPSPAVLLGTGLACLWGLRRLFRKVV
jgi:hypothetical protein